MESKFLSEWPFSLFGFMGFLFLIVIIFFPTIQDSYAKPVYSVDIKNSPKLINQANPGFPASLKIPKLNIESSLERVKLTSDGSVGVPKGPTNAAWFSGSPRPGERGSSIIVGHYGWKDDIPAIFDNLSKLKKGDELYVTDEEGMVITFIVRELKTYGENENPASVFISEDGKSHLNLITCSGVWNKTNKSYSTRLIVFTDKQVENSL